MGILPKEARLDTSTKLGAFLADINVWMSANKLMLNDKNTELVIVKPNLHLKVSDKIQLQVEEKTVHIACPRKNLDVSFYTSLITDR